MAVIRGHNKIVEALITAGADVNFVDNVSYHHSATLMECKFLKFYVRR